MTSQTNEEGRTPNRCVRWLKKYFWEGQSLSKSHEAAQERLSDDAPWYKVVMVKHRRIVGFLLPALVFHTCWWGIFINFNYFHLFKEKYYMSLTMIFGSLIAGMTSEGGGAVAYPVMTLALNIHPSVARDFSLMIQSSGMSAASFSIFFMRVRIEKAALIFSTLGGAVGIIFGFYMVDPILTPPYKKMCFVCIWFTFAFALFLLNRYSKRTTYKRIPDFKMWKGLVLFVAGIVGGIFTSFAGSGLDICSFSVLTLLFRVSEKTATPTSVILMAANSLIGVYWRQIMLGGISTEAWEFLGVCSPIVVIGAPFGSVLGSHFHRLVLASFIYIIDTVSLVSAFILVPLTPWLIGTSVGIIVFGFCFFTVLTKIGERLIQSNARRSSAEVKVESADELEEAYENKAMSNIPEAKPNELSPAKEKEIESMSTTEITSF